MRVKIPIVKHKLRKALCNFIIQSKSHRSRMTYFNPEATLHKNLFTTHCTSSIYSHKNFGMSLLSALHSICLLSIVHHLITLIIFPWFNLILNHNKLCILLYHAFFSKRCLWHHFTMQGEGFL